MADPVGALAPAVTGGQARGLFGPIRGINTPVNGSGGNPYVLDLRDSAGQFIRISAIEEDIDYVFTAYRDGMDYSAQLDTSDQMDFALGVPEIIWECSSDRIVVPPTHPILLVRSATTNMGRVRIRRA